MLFSAAEGLKVVSKASAETAGKITDYVLDAPSARVAALVLKKTSGDGDTLLWEDVVAFGDDAVIVADDTAIVKADDRIASLSDKRHSARGKRVLSSAGAELGEVRDVEFDTTTGTVVALLLTEGQVEGNRLIAIGSYAVVVRA